MQLDFFLTLQRVLVLFLLIVIGYIAGKVGLISSKGQKDITNLVLYITMPATIFSAMQLEFNIERIQRVGVVFVITLFCYLLMFVVGILVSKRMNISPAQQDVVRTSLLLSNTSFMGYPMVLSLLGEEALFYAVIGTGFIFEVVSWSLGVYLIGRRGEGKTNFNLKKIIFSPGILSIVVGLIFFFGQFQVIEPFNSVINSLSPATSPLAMIVVGLILSRSNIKEAFVNKNLYVISAVKLLLVPLIIVFGLKVIGFTGFELVIPAIMLSTPTASYVAMFAQNYNNNPKFASEIVFMTSLLSIITIPIVTLFF